MIDFHNEDCTCDFLSRIKSATIKEEPWRHLIVDDIFCQSCFDKIVQSLSVENTDTFHSFSDDANKKKAMQYMNYTSYDSKAGETITKFRSENHIQQYLESAEYIYSLYPNCRRYDSVYCYPSISRMSSGVSWPVHDDSREKSITMVVYIHPEENIGTTLYKTETEYHHTTEWKPNRAKIFCPESQVTWHGYGADVDNPIMRTTMTWFIQENPLHNKEDLYAKYGSQGDGDNYWKTIFDYISTKKCVKYFN
jgi:hypothetical protein